MANPEIKAVKILIPDGDTISPHSKVVCDEALRIRNQALLYEDVNFGRKPYGRVSRREGGINGCLIEIIPQKTKKRS